MQDVDLRAWTTWQPFVDALRDASPPGAGVVEYSGTISAEYWGGGFRVDGDPSRWPGSSTVDAALTQLAQVAGPIEVAVSCRVGGPGDRVRIVERSPFVERGATSAVSAVVLAAGARPAPFAATAEDWERPAAPTADPAAVASVVAERVHDGVPAPEDALAAFEADLGVALPPEIRALYGAADAGDVPDFEIVPLDGEAAAAFRRAYLPGGRYLGWDQEITRLAPLDPTGRVQSLVGTPRWFVFGRDWDGNAVAADLAPGPSGFAGQVVLLGRDPGAELLADSLADLLAGRVTDPAPVAPDYRVVRLNHRAGLDLAVVDDTTEVLEIGVAPQPIDLAPILGHPHLRALTTIGPTSLADPRQAAVFPNLEYLSLAPAVWHVLADAGPIPASLQAIGFGAFADLDHTIDAANRVTAALGRPPLEVTELHPPA